MQRVHEKKLTDSSTSAALINGEAANQRSRHHGIARQLPRHIGRQFLQLNAKGRQRLVSENSFRGCWCDRNKGRSDKAARVLAGNLFQVTVKNFVAAGESSRSCCLPIQLGLHLFSHYINSTATLVEHRQV
jgi:hypothetical protein